MRKMLSLMGILFMFVLVLPAQSVMAAEYGGFGGRPAYSNEDDSRTDNWFIFDLEPGESTENAVRVVNNTEETKNLRVYPTDTAAASSGGFACSQYLDAQDDVGTWVEMEKDQVTLGPGESEIVGFTFTMPTLADVGEHTGCIVIDEVPVDNGETGVRISKRAGVRIYATVPGELTRELVFHRFEKQRRDDGGMNYFIQMENTGNVSSEAYVQVVTSRYIFGSHYVTHQGAYTISRETLYDWNYQVARPFFGGIFRAELQAGYSMDDPDNAGQEILGEVLFTGSKVYFLLPHPLAMVLYLILIGLIVFLLFMARVEMKRRAWIRKEWVKYKVKSGDTVKKLARQRSVNWKLLIKANGLKPPYELSSGQVIKVPPRKK